MQGLFITGTGTEVGKTYVTTLIAKQLVAAGVRIGVYKPVASGCRAEGGRVIAEDAETIWEAAGKPESIDLVCPQRFMAPLAPNRAAAEEGRQVDAELMRRGALAWQGKCDILLVEGAGGLMSPLSEEDFNADLALDLGFPLLIVASNWLGVINDTLQTVITASVVASDHNNLSVAGVVLNDATSEGDQSRQTNADELRKRLVVPLLGTVAWESGFDTELDWQSLVGDLLYDANATDQPDE